MAVFSFSGRLKWYRSIVFKQMVVLLLVLLPVVVFAAVTLFMLRRSTIDAMTDMTLSSDRVIFDTLDSSIDNILLRQVALLSSGNTQALERLWDIYTEEQRLRRVSSLRSEMMWMEDSFDWIYDLKLYLPRAKRLVMSRVDRELSDEDERRLQAAQSGAQVSVYESGISLSVYTRDSREGNADIRIFCESTLNNYELRKLLRGHSGREKATRVLMVGEQPYLTVGEALGQLPNELSGLVRESREQKRETLVREVRYKGKRCLCTVVLSASTALAMVSLHPYGAFLSQSVRTLWMLVLFSGTCILLAAGFFFYFRRDIKRPIAALQAAFRQLSEGGYPHIDKRPPVDEFFYLYEDFNEMSRRLRESSEQIALQAIEMQRWKLKQLQSQINPHFLYNTLFIIKARIWNGEREGAMQLAELLGSYFQFLNRDAADFVELIEEMEHAHVYTQIQSMRFAGRFSLEWEPCPAEWAEIMIPRLVIQPLVENAIKYGVETTEEGGLLRVYYERQEELSICIEGSGSDISGQEVHRLNRSLENPLPDSRVTSTVNIHRRLQLYYGEGFGLHFSQSRLGGLMVRVKIDPQKRGETV